MIRARRHTLTATALTLLLSGCEGEPTGWNASACQPLALGASVPSALELLAVLHDRRASLVLWRGAESSGENSGDAARDAARLMLSVNDGAGWWWPLELGADVEEPVEHALTSQHVLLMERDFDTAEETYADAGRGFEQTFEFTPHLLDRRCAQSRLPPFRATSSPNTALDADGNVAALWTGVVALDAVASRGGVFPRPTRIAGRPESGQSAGGSPGENGDASAVRDARLAPHDLVALGGGDFVGVFIERSSDGAAPDRLWTVHHEGASARWGEPHEHTAPGDAPPRQASLVAGGDGTAAMLWTASVPDGMVVLVQHYLGGGTWGSPIAMTDEHDEVVAAKLALGDGGRGAVVWWGALARARLFDRDGTVGRARNIECNGCSADAASLAIDADAQLVMGWVQLDGAINFQAFDGQDWSGAIGPERVVDLELRAPRLSRSPQGKVLAAWIAEGRPMAAELDARETGSQRASTSIVPTSM